jgi:fatty acid desaturase
MKTLLALRNSCDRRTIALLSLATFCFIITRQFSIYWLIPLNIILAISACCAKHNHTHCPTFRSRAMNRLFDLWLTLLSGSSSTGIRVAHQVRHHSHNQSAEDFVRTSLVTQMPAAKALIRYVPSVIRESWSHTTEDFNINRRKKLRHALWQERILLWCFIVLLLWQNAALFLWVFGIPWVIAQWFLIAMNLPQHDGLDEQCEWNHSRNVIGTWSNWIFLNNGFHTAHHARPALHWSALPAWHEEQVAPHIDHQLNHSSLMQFWLAWWQQRNHAS